MRKGGRGLLYLKLGDRGRQELQAALPTSKEQGAKVGYWTMSREGSHECPPSAGVCAGTMVAGAMGTSD